MTVKSNPDNAINHVKSLSFGRQAATNGESRGIEYIQDQLTKAKIKSYLVNFIFSNVMLRNFRAFAALVLSCSILRENRNIEEFTILWNYNNPHFLSGIKESHCLCTHSLHIR